MFTKAEGIWILLKSFCLLFSPIISFVGYIINVGILLNPYVLNENNCSSRFQPVILLIPTIFPLGYYCYLSLFQMIDTFTVDMDEHFIIGETINVLLSIIKFAGLLLALLWYCYFIYVALDQYKIAKRRARSLLLDEPVPAAPHQCYSQSSVDMKNENLNNSNEII